jgi:predicted aspartyl protease
MKPAKYIAIFVSVLATLGLTAAQSVPDTQVLDDGRQWLDSRSLPAPTAPALVRAAAANARNQSAVSESLLLSIVQSQPASDSARRAYELLSRIYLRSGQYRRVTANLDRWARAFPDDPHLGTEKADVEQFRGLPDQINGRRVRSTLRHGPGNDFAVPVLINGRRATYLLDTGAWMSVMTEAEAKRLGLTIREGTGVLGESSGKGVKIRTAVAKTLSLGSMSFHDVSFAVLPDVEPWKSMPTGRGGIIGAPVLLHLGCIRWMKGGWWEIGCRDGSSRSDTANMVFFGNHLLLASTVANRQSFMTLDTGAETTDLNANFAREFAREIQDVGTKSTTRVEGLGGSSVIDSITVPKLDFLIGGKSAPLRAANVTLQENSALGGRCCIGNIGLDLLLQTGRVTIDFSRMTLSLR